MACKKLAHTAVHSWQMRVPKFWSPTDPTKGGQRYYLTMRSTWKWFCIQNSWNAHFCLLFVDTIDATPIQIDGFCTDWASRPLNKFQGILRHINFELHVCLQSIGVNAINHHFNGRLEMLKCMMSNPQRFWNASTDKVYFNQSVGRSVRHDRRQ